MKNVNILIIFLMIAVLSFFVNVEAGSNELPAEYKSKNMKEGVSIFWYSFFKSRSASAGLIPAEFLKFTAIDSDPSSFIHKGDVIDIFSGGYLGGSPFDGFYAGIEGGKIMHLLKPKNDDYYKFRRGHYIASDAKIGIPILELFTFVIHSNLKLWQGEILTKNTPLSSYKNLTNHGFLFRTEALFYFELIKSIGSNTEKIVALNIYGGVGYHLYRSKEKKLDNEYHPPATDDFDILAGVNCIINWQFSFDIRIYFYGTFSASLSLCMLG